MFSKLKLADWVTDSLTKQGFTVPTEIQSKCIPLIIEGKDVLGRSQTGSGKTFAFGLPAMSMVDSTEQGIEVLVVCPTRELAQQVTDEIRKIANGAEGVKVVPVFGGADMSRQIKALKNAKIVVGTPGRLIDHLNRRTLKLHNLKMVVLDEADEMLNMGFRTDIETILKSAPSVRQTVMFSATMPAAIKELTTHYMTDPQYVEIGQLNSTLEEIEQSYVRVPKNAKNDVLQEIFTEFKPLRAIVFCNTKRMVDTVAAKLNRNGTKAYSIHGDLRQSQRRRIMDEIKSIDRFVLVATDVAARGIDIKSVDYIINYDLPLDIELYLHRIGRTGRAGNSGQAISIINTLGQYVQFTEFAKETKSKLTELTNLCSEDMVAQRELEDLERSSSGKMSRSASRSRSSSSQGRGTSAGRPKTFNKARMSSDSDRPMENKQFADKVAPKKSFGAKNASVKKSFGDKSEALSKDSGYKSFSEGKKRTSTQDNKRKSSYGETRSIKPESGWQAAPKANKYAASEDMDKRLSQSGWKSKAVREESSARKGVKSITKTATSKSGFGEKASFFGGGFGGKKRSSRPVGTAFNRGRRSGKLKKV